MPESDIMEGIPPVVTRLMLAEVSTGFDQSFLGAGKSVFRSE